MSCNTYQRLGDYIREVNVLNWDLKVSDLLGVEHCEEIYFLHCQHHWYEHVSWQNRKKGINSHTFLYKEKDKEINRLMEL